MLMALGCLTLKAQTNFRTITYQQALAQAKAEGKTVFMDFYTDWCGPCKLMMREVFPQKGVGDYMNSHFVSIKVNAEKGEGISLAKRYNIQAYPTFVIIDPQENEKGRLEGYREAEVFIPTLNRIIDPNETPEKLQARYDAGERTAALVRAYAAMIMNRGKGRRLSLEQLQRNTAEAEAIAQDYFSHLDKAGKLNPENMFVYRTYTGSTEKPSGQFMLASRGAFGQYNAEIDSLLRQFCLRDLSRYVSGTVPYDEAKLQALKNVMDRMNVNPDGKYDPVFSLIKERAGSEDNYLSAFERAFGQLPADMQMSAISGVVNRFKDKEESVRKKAGKSIRRQMVDMDSGLLYSAFMSLYEIEGPRH